MNRCLRVRLRWALSLALTVLLVGQGFSVAVYALPTGYQEYYVLGYEEHVWRAFEAIYGSSVSADICSTVSLVATADSQIIYYDHWEDGYEADLLHPVQASTAVYFLGMGATLSLTSTVGSGPTINQFVSVPRSSSPDPGNLRYDGGDRIIATGGPVALTHAMWPSESTWAGGAWEVYSRQTYADSFSYRLPIGQNLYAFDPAAYGDFEHVYLQLQVFEDNTTVSVDNGSQVVNLTLDRGQTYSSMGYINSTIVPSITINAGTSIRSDKPAQVGLVTGRTSERFQSRLMIVLPDQLWGADYVVPVPSEPGIAPAEVYLSNPNDFPIAISAYDSGSELTFVVSPTAYISSTVPYSLKRGGTPVPSGSAVRFTSSDGTFGVVVCADTAEPDFDWGFSAIPAQNLTRDYYVSWAPGNSCLPPDDPNCVGGVAPAENGSPVWVTPLAARTTFYVDYSPLDGDVDEVFRLDPLQQRRIFDPDKDNTGMHIWATDKFAVAWGEDPGTAGAGDPYLDLGLAVVPPLDKWLDPALTLDKTAQPTILPPQGGVVTFTLVAQAFRFPLSNVDLTDTLPISWTYVPNSTRLTYPDGSEANPEPLIGGQDLAWDLSVPLGLDQAITLTFRAQITATEGMTVSTNRARVTGQQTGYTTTFAPSAEATVYVSPLSLHKAVNRSHVEIGETLVYTLSYANLSASETITDVVLRDVVPVQHVSRPSVSSGGVYSDSSAQVNWALGSLAPGASGAVTLSAKVHDFVHDGTAVENRGYIRGYGTGEAGSNVVRTGVLAPNVKLSKSAPTVAAPGQSITYTLRYDNVGGASATGVTIRDKIPLSTTYLTGSLAIMTGTEWLPLTDAHDGDGGAFISPTLIITPGVVPGTVAPGEEGYIRFSVRADQDLLLGWPILNWAMLYQDLKIPRGSNLAVTRIYNIPLSKAATQTAAAPEGVISYTLSYTNVTQAITQTNVYVREPVPAYTTLLSGTVFGADGVEYSWDNGVTWSATPPISPVTHLRWQDAELPPLAGTTVGFAVRVNATLPPDTTISNLATISSTQSGLSYSNLVHVPTLDLEIAKAASTSTVAPGKRLTYTLTYGNKGTSPALGATITDRIPLSTTLVPGSVTGPAVSDGQAITWNLDVPARISGLTVGFAVTVAQDIARCQPITNQAHLSHPYDAAQSAPLDVIPTALCVAGFAPAYSETGTGIPITFTNTSQEAASYLWDLGDGTLTTTVSPVHGYGTPGTYTVTLAATGTCGYATDAATTTVRVRPTLLQVAKYAAPWITPGGVLTYTVVVSNDIPGYQASGVAVSDTLPANTQFVPGSIALDPPEAGILGTAPPVLAHDMTIASGHSVTLSFAATVDRALPSGTLISNTVGVTSAQAPTPITGAVTTVVRAPVLTLVKVASSAGGGPIAGMPLTYTITVTNAGDGAASQVVVTDALPVGASYVSGGTLLAGGNVVQWDVGAVPTAQGRQVSFVVSTCQTSLLNAAYRVVTSAQGIDSPLGPPLATLLSPPTIAADWVYTPSSVVVNRSVLFTSASTTDGGPIRQWDWAFGDLGTAAGPTVSHTYRASGWYTVTLQVTDGCGYTDTVSQPLLVRSPLLTVGKSSRHPTPLGVGDTITYTIVVDNAGNAEATEATVWDPLPANTAFLPGSIRISPPGAGTPGTVPPTLASGLIIPAGESVTVTFAVQVSSPLTTGTAITNSASITSAEVPTPSAALVVDVVDSADLSVDKQSQPSPALPGEAITYTIVVSNRGLSHVVGATVSDTLPLEVGSATWSCVAAAGAACTGSGTGDIYDTVALPALSVMTYTVVGQLSPGITGTLANTATVALPPAIIDVAPGDNTATDFNSVLTVPNVAVTKDDALGTVHPGGRLTYTLTISNVGNEIATGIRVTDVLPQYTAYASAPEGGAETSPGSGIVTWPPFGLSAGQSVTRALIVDVDALPPEGVGSLANTAFAVDDGSHGDDPNPDNNVYTHTTSLRRAPALSIVKDGPDTARVGQVVTYTFTITNDLGSGDGSPIRNLSVSDDRAGAASYVTGDDGDELLQVGEAWVFQVRYVIGRSQPSPLVNTGTVSGEDLEGDVLTATAIHSTDLQYAPGLSVIKAGPKTAKLGQSIVYSFTVSNVAFTPTSMRTEGQGDGSPIKGLTVVDDLLGSPSYVGGDDGDGLLEIGETWLYAAGHTIHETDPDPLINHVTASGLNLNSEPVLNTATHSLDIEYVPVLDTTIDGPATAKIGDTLVFTYALSHAKGSDGSPVHQLTVTDSLSGTARYVGGDDGDGHLERDETWIYGTSYVVRPNDWNPLIDVVTVSGLDRDDATITVIRRHLTVIVDAISAVYLPIISQGE